MAFQQSGKPEGGSLFRPEDQRRPLDPHFAYLRQPRIKLNKSWVGFVLKAVHFDIVPKCSNDTNAGVLLDADDISEGVHNLEVLRRMFEMEYYASLD